MEDLKEKLDKIRRTSTWEAGGGLKAEDLTGPGSRMPYKPPPGGVLPENKGMEEKLLELEA